MCRVRLWKRHESSSEFAPHAASPSALLKREECSSFSLFLLFEVFVGFFCSFFNLVFGRGVTLLRRVWFGENLSEGDVVYIYCLFTKQIFLFDVHISVLCLLQLCTVKCSLFKMNFS